MAANKGSCIRYWILGVGLALSVLAPSDLRAKQDGGSFAVIEKLFLEGKYEAVVAESSRLIDSDYSQSDDLYYIKGLSELKTSRFAGARRSFERIIDSSHGRPSLAFDAYVGIGDSYLLEGNHDKAAETYRGIMERFPDNKNLALVRSRMELSSGGDFQQPDAVKNDVPGPRRMAVQVGSFSSKTNAERLARKLSKKGYRSRIDIPTGPNDHLYRVKVDGAASRSAAESLALRLKQDGFSTKICPET